MNIIREQDEDDGGDEQGDKLTTRTRETTYGSDFWKQQYKTAEIEVLYRAVPTLRVPLSHGPLTRLSVCCSARRFWGRCRACRWR